MKEIKKRKENERKGKRSMNLDVFFLKKKKVQCPYLKL